jgi:alkylation response protein AidB-like acyl-CoA dehydrogenase
MTNVASNQDSAAGGRESLSERIAPYLAEIKKRSPETEKNRMVPPENIELIRNAGFVRSFVPKSKGGDERDLVDYCEGVRAVTKACPATGWVTGVLNVHPAAIAFFTKAAQDKVWATGPDTIVCSSGTPAMKAKLVEGGILVNGKGRWASGCDHAEWAMVGVKVPNLADSQYPERNYISYMFLAHKSQYEIDDTWYSMGQRGSGSKDLVFKDFFVPWELLERQDGLTFMNSKGNGSVSSDWVTEASFTAVFTTFLPAIALGCADGMIEEFTKRQQSRKNAYTGAQGILNPTGYMHLADARMELDCLTVFYHDQLNRLQQSGVNRDKLTEKSFMASIAQLTYVADRAVKVIEKLFTAAGSSAIADFNPMQRYWRDGHTVRLHTGMDYDTWMQHYGRALMGLMPTPDL